MKTKGMLIAGFAAGLALAFAFTALPAVQEKPFKLDMYRVFSGVDLPQIVSCKVRQGDTIESIAKLYQTTIELIKILNVIYPDLATEYVIVMGICDFIAQLCPPNGFIISPLFLGQGELSSLSIKPERFSEFLCVPVPLW